MFNLVLTLFCSTVAQRKLKFNNNITTVSLPGFVSIQNNIETYVLNGSILVSQHTLFKVSSSFFWLNTALFAFNLSRNSLLSRPSLAIFLPRRVNSFKLRYNNRNGWRHQKKPKSYLKNSTVHIQHLKPLRWSTCIFIPEANNISAFDYIVVTVRAVESQLSQTEILSRTFTTTTCIQ